MKRHTTLHRPFVGLGKKLVLAAIANTRAFNQKATSEIEVVREELTSIAAEVTKTSKEIKRELAKLASIRRAKRLSVRKAKQSATALERAVAIAESLDHKNPEIQTQVSEARVKVNNLRKDSAVEYKANLTLSQQEETVIARICELQIQLVPVVMIGEELIARKHELEVARAKSGNFIALFSLAIARR